MIRKLALALLLLFAALPVCAQTYTVRTDTNNVPETIPTLCSPAPCNITSSDMNPGTVYTRVTQPTAFAGFGCANSATLCLQHTNGSSEARGWNSNSTMFYTTINGGVNAFYTVSSGPPQTATRLPCSFSDGGVNCRDGFFTSGSISPNGDFPFSSVSPYVIYGALNGRITKSDFSATVGNPATPDTRSNIGNAISACPGFPFASTANQNLLAVVNDGDTRWGVLGGGGQDVTTFLYVWDSTQGCRWLSFGGTSPTVGGSWGTTGAAVCFNEVGTSVACNGCGGHNARMDRSGRWFHLEMQCTRDYVWDIPTGNLYLETVPGTAAPPYYNGGHLFMGWNNIMIGGDRTVSGGSPTGMWIAKHVYPPSGTPTWLVQHDYSGWDSHLTWMNQTSGGTQPIILITNLDSCTSGSGATWQDEILGISEDGSGTVYRFGHAFSRNCNFFDQGMPNVSPNGKWAVFTSSWGSTSTYDTYLIALPMPTGGSAVVNLAPTSVAFGNVLVGSTSPSSTVKLTNTGTGTLVFSGAGITLAGTNPTDFAQSNNCGTAVNAGGSCNIVVTCTPASAASFSASVSITDNAAGSPQAIPLTCTGITATPQIGFSPASIAFAPVTVGASSSPTPITVSNPGSANLVISAITITGGNTTSFTQTNNCTTVAPAGTCTINVTFSPKVAGSLSTSVAVTDNAAGSPQVVPLTGTGNGVPGIGFAPTSLAFGNQTVSSTSGALSVTVSNPGTATLTLTSETLTGTNAADFAISANTCGGTLTIGSTCVVSVTFTPGATGSRTANLTFTDNAAGSPQQVALSGTGTQAGAGFSPTSLAFPNTNVGTTSAPLTTTLTNTGTATLNIASITVVGVSDFAISSNTCGTTLGVSATCTVSVTFTPTTNNGQRTANLSFADNAPASPQTVPLSGLGIAASISISPSSLTFPSTVLGAASPSQTVFVTNTGNETVTFTSIAITGGNAGDFSQTNTCLPSVSAACQVTVTFSPAAIGARASTLVFTDSAPTSPQSVTLSGVGTQSGALVSPTSVTFANQPVGTTSAASNVTLTNNGTATLNIASILLGGTNSSYFAISANACGGTLAVNANCVVSLTFTPQTAIAASGTLTFTDDGPSSPQVVNLSGLGTFLALSFAPASLAFGSVNVGTTSPTQTFTMTNNGNGVATISGITIIGTNAGDFSQTNNCPPNIAGGGSCTFSVKFLPTASGARSASVQVTDNAPGSPQTVALTGTGVTPTAGISLSPTSLTFASQGVGTSSASQPITVSNPGSGNLVISSVAISGDYSQTNNCTTVAPAGTCTVNVTFTPTNTGTRTGVLTISDNAAGSPHTAPLTGTGTAAAVSFVPASLTFPNTPVGSASAVLTTTLKNTGGASLTGIVISIVGTNAADYAQTNNCGTSVIAGGSCTINVTFTPSANGSRTANVQVVDNIGTQTVPLQGTGFTPAPAVSLSVASINFGDQTVSTQSNPHTVVLTNVGTATLTVSAATKTGANPGDYSVSTTCGVSLAVNATCSYSIVFIPTGAGSRTATLNVNTNAASSPDLVSLAGNGVSSGKGALAPQDFGDD